MWLGVVVLREAVVVGVLPRDGVVELGVLRVELGVVVREVVEFDVVLRPDAVELASVVLREDEVELGVVLREAVGLVVALARATETGRVVALLCARALLVVVGLSDD
jgi:hypothetical protein